MNRNKQQFPILLAVGGLLLILVAFFAKQIGIDNNDHWGFGRYALAGAGMCLWLGLAWIVSVPQRQNLAQRLEAGWRAVGSHAGAVQARQAWRKTIEAGHGSTLAQFLNKAWRRFLSLPGVRYIAASSDRQAVFWALCGLALTLLIYTWLATAGTMARLTPSTGFIDLQGQAFLKGQISLVETPPADLLALKNPYDLTQRLKLKYIWDASLYRGKYYLYWGPLPALMDASYRGITNQGLGDEVFGFLFLCLLAVIETLWLLDLRKTFFPKFNPAWLLFFGLAVNMLSPLAYNISGLSVYVVSILSAQVFLLGGVLLVRRAFSGGRVAAWRWVSSGLLLGLAVSARINLVLVVAWLGLLLLGWVLFAGREKRAAALKAGLLAGAALGLVLAALMVYNQVRFDSPFEFGSRYQLTATDNNHNYNSIVSITYILPNLYVYLFRLPAFRAEFPFIYSQWVMRDSFPAFIVLPSRYLSTDPVDGLLLTSPFILLAILPFWQMLAELRLALMTRPIKNWTGYLFSQRSLFWAWSGCGLIAFVFILSYYYPTMRYLIDCMPALGLMAAAGGWQWQSSGRFKDLKSFVIIMLVLVTLVAGFLLCINGTHAYFEQANPALYYRLIGFFKGQ